MVVGEDRVAGRIVVIRWQDAALSLLASSPHSDNIRMRRRGGDALDSHQHFLEEKDFHDEAKASKGLRSRQICVLES